MRKEPNLRVENFRLNGKKIPHSAHGKNYGIFRIGPLHVISSGSIREDEWEHVSVSTARRTPSWQEMVKVKDLFWRDDETVVQFHPAKSDYVNTHQYCLHMWRKRGVEVELPPRDHV